MKKKVPSLSRKSISSPPPDNTVLKWRSIPPRDFHRYAQSSYSAAKKLARTLEVDPGPVLEFDLCPVLSAYRYAIELHLKVIVLRESEKFLASGPDELSVHKTRSVSWLAQFVAQIITALKWENRFTAEGIHSLNDFKAVIEEANNIERTFDAFRCPANPDRPDNLVPAVLDFVRRLDAVVVLLESTADALAAEWPLISTPMLENWPDSKSKIQ